MMGREPLADEAMVREALGDEYDALAIPPNADVPKNHPLWPKLLAALSEVYDPEIPVNVFELGLIYRITPKELEMARELIESMAGPWKPADYHDEFRARLHEVIEKRLKQKGVVHAEEAEPHLAENATTNVVDFMALLKNSLNRKGGRAAAASDEDSPRKARAPAKKAAAKKSPRKAPAKTASKKSSARSGR